MKTLQANRQISIIIGICAPSDGCDFRVKIAQIINIILILVSLMLFEWFSLNYIMQYLRVDNIENCLVALKQIIAVAATIASFISLFAQMDRVRNFFDRIQHVFDKCKLNLKSFSFRQT